jgi:transmembrane sensor
VEKYKFEQYTQGASDEVEKLEMESLFLNGETNQNLRHALESDFNKIIIEDSYQNVYVDHILDKIHHKIRENEMTIKQRPINRIIRMYSKVAAMLLIPLILSVIILYVHKGAYSAAKSESVNSTIYAPLGSRISFALPDGTTGMLNSGSSISYSIPFNNDRKLTLSGEGWFEVKHDEEHPFIISALNTSIKVLGTSFNLSAYKEENYVEIVLNSGKIQFIDKISNKEILILPNERLILKDGKIEKSIIDTSKYNGWTKGKLIFRGDLMGEVARRIMRWYNVDIVLADKELENYSFRGIFEDDKIEDILTFLAMTSPISYEIIPRSINQDGTFIKEKIIISLLKGKS